MARVHGAEMKRRSSHELSGLDQPSKPLFDRRVQCVDEQAGPLSYVGETIHDSLVRGEASLVLLSQKVAADPN